MSQDSDNVFLPQGRRSFCIRRRQEEELGGDERIHITLGDDDHVHSLQKGLKGIFTAAEFADIMDEARSRCAELRDLVNEKLEGE